MFLSGIRRVDASEVVPGSSLDCQHALYLLEVSSINFGTECWANANLSTYVASGLVQLEGHVMVLPARDLLKPVCTSLARGIRPPCKVTDRWLSHQISYLILDEVIPEAAFPSYTGMGCVVTAGEGADYKKVYNFFIQLSIDIRKRESWGAHRHRLGIVCYIEGANSYK